MQPVEGMRTQSVAQNSLLSQGVKLIAVSPERTPCAPIRNDGKSDGYRAEAAMISCSIATWRANAPRPAAVAVTVVCGFLPTKAFSTAT